jgi:hypothetical protein
VKGLVAVLLVSVALGMYKPKLGNYSYVILGLVIVAYIGYAYHAGG